MKVSHIDKIKLDRKLDKRVKLSDDDVSEIRRLYFTTNITIKELSKKYNVSITTIRFKINPDLYEDLKDYRKTQPHPIMRNAKEQREYIKELRERKLKMIKYEERKDIK